MKKRILSILLAWVLLCSLMPPTVFAAELPDGAAWLVDEGDNHVWYKLTEENTVLTLGGSGAMPNFDLDNHSPWYSSKNAITTINIQQGVTNIGDEAFTCCYYLTNITIPDGVTSIGNNAFDSCTSLTNITLPTSLTNIGNGAFLYCYGFTNVTIPANVTSIGTEAFKNCSALTAISVDSNNSSYSDIDGVLFNKDKTCLICFPTAKTVTDGAYTIPAGVTSIASSAFYNCQTLTSIILPESVTNIGDNAFQYCTLTSVTLPEGLTYIGSYTFGNCSKLASVNIPKGVTSIGENAFTNSGLTSIEIPANVESIGAYAFRACSKLASVTLNEGLKTIETDAFANCTALTSIEIPSSVTMIADTMWGGDRWRGDGVFGRCSALTSVTLHEGLTYIGSNAFSKCSKLVNINIPKSVTSIGDFAFGGCSLLANITLPEKLTSIGSSAFNACSALTSIEIPANVESIGAYAFSSCSKLESVKLNEGLKTIETGTFARCRALASIVIPSSVTTIADGSNSAGAFSGCSALASVTLSDGLTYIGKYAFEQCKALTSINIPKTVTSIGSSAFSGCSTLASINIPEGVTSIDSGTFSGCKALTNITIPEGVTSIGSSAFYNCEKITSITIPEKAESIGDKAFYGCSALEQIIVKASTPPAIGGANAFMNCNALTTIYVPVGTEEAYKAADVWSTKADIIKGAYVIITAAADNCAITVDKDYFPIDTYTEANETVTVTVTPNEGYQLKSLKYNDGEDHDITETKTFTMPLANVTVTAEFEEPKIEVSDLFFWPEPGGAPLVDIDFKVKSNVGGKNIVFDVAAYTKDRDGYFTVGDISTDNGASWTQDVKKEYEKAGTTKDIHLVWNWKRSNQDTIDPNTIDWNNVMIEVTARFEGEAPKTASVTLPAGMHGYSYIVSKVMVGEDAEIPPVETVAGVATYELPVGAKIAISAVSADGHVISPVDPYIIGKVTESTTVDPADLPKLTAFEAWNDATKLPDTAGNYYLTSDVTLDATWNVPTGETNLCLNGHIINANATDSNKFNVIDVNRNATFNLYDCGTTEHYFTVGDDGLWTLTDTKTETAKTVTGGVITGGYSMGRGGGVYVEKGTFTMNGGNIIGNNEYGNGGSGVHVDEGSFTMNAGRITGNTTGNHGGGVYVDRDSNFTMNAGSITDNTARGCGGGVNVGSGSFTMNGGSITGNTAGYYGGGVYVGYWAGNVILGGKANITSNFQAIDESKNADNLYLDLYDDDELEETPDVSRQVTLGTGTGEGGNGVAAPMGDFSVGITMQTPGKFTTNGTEDEVKYFTSDNSAYIVTSADDESGLALVSPVIKFTKTQAQWEDKAAGKWNLGIVGTFNTSDIDIDFNEKGTSTNVSAVGVIVSAGEYTEQQTTRFVYATENENEYCYRAVIKNIPYNVSSEKTITVQFFATVDGKNVLGEIKTINLADAYTTAINNGMPAYEG